MELRAKSINRKAPRKGRGPATPPAAPSIRAVEETASRASAHHSITVRYDTLQNMIRSSHTAHDFTFASLADFIRAALKAYKDGMVLTELDRGGPKLETSLRVDRELWLFYKALPSRLRAKILERVIRTFMKQQSETSGQSKTSASQGSRRKRQSAR